MNINEIKPGNYYTNGHGVYVMASGAVQDNEFQATNIELGQVRMYPISEFSHTTFHEAFRDNVNKIVMEAIFAQNKEVLYDWSGSISMAVSDLQKKWILEHYILKYNSDKRFEDLQKAHDTLINEYKDLQKENNELNHEVAKCKNSSKFENDDAEYLRARVMTLTTENNDCKKQIMGFTQKLINQQREYDQRFCDLYDKKTGTINQLNSEIEQLITDDDNQKKFIQHLQDYIAAKHLESEGLILEKFIQEEIDNGRKEST